MIADNLYLESLLNETIPLSEDITFISEDNYRSSIVDNSYSFMFDNSYSSIFDNSYSSNLFDEDYSNDYKYDINQFDFLNENYENTDLYKLEKSLSSLPYPITCEPSEIFNINPISIPPTIEEEITITKNHHKKSKSQKRNKSKKGHKMRNKSQSTLSKTHISKFQLKRKGYRSLYRANDYDHIIRYGKFIGQLDDRIKECSPKQHTMAFKTYGVCDCQTQVIRNSPLSRELCLKHKR